MASRSRRGAKMASLTPKMNQYFRIRRFGALHDVDFMVKDSRGSPTAADGDGPCSNMTLHPARSRPAPRPMLLQANDAKCGYSCHTVAGKGLRFHGVRKKVKGAVDACNDVRSPEIEAGIE